jgi:hypothetical protein
MSTALDNEKVAVEDQGRLDGQGKLEAQGNSPSDLSDNESFTNPTGINENKLLRKLDLKLLPPLSLLYLLSFLDRSNGKYSPYFITGSN